MSMAKGTVEKRALTEDEIADAARLKSYWLRYKEAYQVNQEWLAKETGLGKQSLIGQYLNAGIQLNPKAVIAFSRVFNISPSEISPRMLFPDSSLTKDEAELLSDYRLASAQSKEILRMTAKSLERETDKATAAPDNSLKIHKK